MPVLASAQPQAWQQAQRRWLIFQSARGLAVFAAAAGLLWFGDSCVAGFAVLAALMLGAALILPMILEIVLSLGQRSARSARSASGSGPTAASSFPDCRWRLMALLLALAVNVGVGTMVESFSRTFLVWLDGRLAADVYVSAARRRAGERDQGVAARAAARSTAMLPGGRADTQLGGMPVEVLGLPDHATYRDNWPLLESAPTMPGSGCVPAMPRFVSEQLARR